MLYAAKNAEDIDDQLINLHRIENTLKPLPAKAKTVFYQNVVNAEVPKIRISKP